MAIFPDVITHNYDPARGIGRNLCHLPDSDAERILDEIRASTGRFIRTNYLSRRRGVEEWLITEKQRKLGTTVLNRPIYFFLGDFADGKDPSRPASLVMPLAEFQPDMVTFTYPDSMASLPLATKDDHKLARKAYHGSVFTLSEIRTIVAKFGLPESRPINDPASTYERYIEVQVWDDWPVKCFLAKPINIARQSHLL